MDNNDILKEHYRKKKMAENSTLSMSDLYQWEKEKELKKKQEEIERVKTLENRDDGTVRGLLLSGDYVKKITGGYANSYELVFTYSSDDTWDIVEDSLPHPLITISSSNENSKYYKNMSDETDKIVTLCRRKLKKQDIALVEIKKGSSYSGLIFTDKSLYVLYEDKLDYIIDYCEMEEIDFDENELVISVTEGDTVNIDCWYNDRAQCIFNILMDIKDRIEE